MKQSGESESRLQLLHEVSGSFRPSVLTCLMGVSGAGKTTLMDVLAGRKTGGYILKGQSLFLDILSTSSFLLTLLRSSKERMNQSGKMWRRLSTKLRNLPASSSLLKPNNNSIRINNLQTSSSSTPPPPSSAPLFSVGKKMVEDFMPIATGHEKEELEAQILGRDLLEINHPVGPFGTKEAPAIVKSYYDKRIVGCPGGGVGEDEHDVVWFWLDKGHAHVCPVCSQYFKLEVVGPGGPPDRHGDGDHH